MNWFRRRDRELDEELAFHMEMQTRKNLAAGMNPEQARRQARVQFGMHEEAVKDYVRDSRRLGFLETFLHDLRYALRGLRHAPVFALTVVLTIGLGLGWNTAAFTIFNAYVLRPLAVPDPYSLYGMTWSDRVGRTHLFTWEQSQQFRNSDSPFQLAGAVNYNVRVRMDGHLAQGQLVDADYFRILGLDAVQGRTFLPEDVRAPGSEPLVVISYAAWQSWYAGEPNTVGRRVMLHGHPFTIIGITPQMFTSAGAGAASL